MFTVADARVLTKSFHHYETTFRASFTDYEARASSRQAARSPNTSGQRWLHACSSDARAGQSVSQPARSPPLVSPNTSTTTFRPRRRPPLSIVFLPVPAPQDDAGGCARSRGRTCAAVSGTPSALHSLSAVAAAIVGGCLLGAWQRDNLQYILKA
jgi:hypothetical protein